MTIDALVRQAAAFSKRLKMRLGVQMSIPGNFQPRDATQAAVDAEYGLGCGKSFKYQIERAGLEIRGARVLEVGPGTGFGGAAYLAAHGASPTVADRWLAPWQPDYHGPYYRAVADLLDTEDKGGDSRSIRGLAEAGAYDDGPIGRIDESAEALPERFDGAFDAVISNAVLEHVADPAQAFARLFQVTRPGGVGAHQVDFRDHRDFSRPLEFLLLSEAAFARITKAFNHDYGSQRRQTEYAALLRGAGFEILDYSSNEQANDAYLSDFVPRLRAAKHSPWRDLPEEILRDLGGLFLVRRRAD